MERVSPVSDTLNAQNSGGNNFLLSLGGDDTLNGSFGKDLLDESRKRLH